MFIEEIKDGFVVNHKDGNKQNNDVTNLEIISQKQNVVHAFENKLMTHEKPILVYDLNGNFIKEFESYTKCAEEYNSSIENVRRCIDNNTNTLNRSFQLRTKESSVDVLKEVCLKNNQKIAQYDANMNLIEIFTSENQIHKKLFGKRSNGIIRKGLENNKTFYYFSYYWQFIN